MNQFALAHPYKGVPVRSTGCLSDLEAAFRVMRIPDPCPEAQWHGRLAAWVEGWTYEEWALRNEAFRMLKGDT